MLNASCVLPAVPCPTASRSSTRARLGLARLSPRPRQRRPLLRLVQPSLPPLLQQLSGDPPLLSPLPSRLLLPLPLPSRPPLPRKQCRPLLRRPAASPSPPRHPSQRPRRQRLVRRLPLLPLAALLLPPLSMSLGRPSRRLRGPLSRSGLRRWRRPSLARRCRRASSELPRARSPPYLVLSRHDLRVPRP